MLSAAEAGPEWAASPSWKGPLPLRVCHILSLPSFLSSWHIWTAKSVSFPLGLVAPSLFLPRLLAVRLEPSLTLAQPSVFGLLHSPRPAAENSGLISPSGFPPTLRSCVLVTSSRHSLQLAGGLTLTAGLGLSLGSAVLVIKLHRATRQGTGQPRTNLR